MSVFVIGQTYKIALLDGRRFSAKLVSAEKHVKQSSKEYNFTSYTFRASDANIFIDLHHDPEDNDWRINCQGCSEPVRGFDIYHDDNEFIYLE